MVKVVDKKGKTHEVPEVMYQKQGANMGWTLVETDIAETPTVTPTDETLKFIESQKAALEAPVVETVTDETDALRAAIERLKAENEKIKAELAKKDCKKDCTEITIENGDPVTGIYQAPADKPEIPKPNPVVKKTPVKRKPRTKKTTK